MLVFDFKILTRVCI